MRKRYVPAGRREMYIWCDRKALHRPSRPKVPIVQFERFSDAEMANGVTYDGITIKSWHHAWHISGTRSAHFNRGRDAPSESLYYIDGEWTPGYLIPRGRWEKFLAEKADKPGSRGLHRAVWRLVCEECESRYPGGPVVELNDLDTVLDLVAASGKREITIALLSRVVGKMNQ